MKSTRLHPPKSFWMSIKSFFYNFFHNPSIYRKYMDGDADTWYEWCMLFFILVNTISLGLETSKTVMENYSKILLIIDQVCLWIFIVEIIIKIIVYNKFFFKKPQDCINSEKRDWNLWNIFDLAIVIVSVFASFKYLTVLRALRIIRSVKIVSAFKSLRIVRTFKLINSVKQIRKIFKAILNAIPSIFWTAILILIFIYVYAVIGTNMLNEDFPEFFGNLGLSMVSLLQIATFDSWVSQIARPVIIEYPITFVYFLTYVFFSAWILLNSMIGLIVDSINNDNNKEILKKLDELQAKIEKLQITKDSERLE